MQFFPLLNFQQLVLAFFLGAGFVFLIYVALNSYSRDRAEMGPEDLDKLEEGDLAEAHDPEGGGIAPVLIFIYLGVVVWAVSYVLVVGINGPAF
jgi:hypothetical protein